MTEINIVIDKSDKRRKVVTISHNGSSGAEYTYRKEDELTNIIINYIKNYIGGECL